MDPPGEDKRRDHFAKFDHVTTSRRLDTLGLGLAALGRPAYITSGRAADFGAARSVEQMRRRTAEVLDAAYDAGIRYFDAARSYGRAEEFLAAWLRSRPDVDDVFVASKWGYRYVGEWRLDADAHELKEHTVEMFDTQWAQTRSLLGDRVGLYQVHSVTETSPVLTDVTLQSALAGLRDSGVAIGLSVSGPRQADAIRAALAVEIGGLRLFSSVQATWNLLETSATDALVDAHAGGVAVVLKEVFANGRLAPGGSDAGRAADLAAELGVGLDQLAVNVAATRPWVSHVLTGAATTAQVRSHVQGVELALPDGLLDDLGEVAEEPERYWAARSERSWA